MTVRQTVSKIGLHILISMSVFSPINSAQTTPLYLDPAQPVEVRVKKIGTVI